MEKNDYFLLNECPLKFNSLRDRGKKKKLCVLRASQFRLLKSVEVLLPLNLIHVGSFGVCCSTGSFPRLRPSVTGSFYESLFKDEGFQTEKELAVVKKKKKKTVFVLCGYCAFP